MTPGGNDFNDFPEILPIREITTKTEKTFFLARGRGAYFLSGPSVAASIALT